MRRPTLLFLAAPLCALLLAACGSAVATSSFKGTSHDVAQTIADLQSDVTAGEQKKICANDLAKAVVSRLGGTKGCESAVKTQVAEIDSTELSVQSVDVAGSSATAKVKSISEGKTHESEVALVKEDGHWRVSALR
jgi:hypothetical protein